MRNALKVLVSASTMLLSACDSILLDRISVENQSEEFVGDLLIDYGGTRLSIPRLDPGEMWNARVEPSSGGLLSISFIRGDDLVEVTGDDYIVPKETRRCRIIISRANATIEC